MFINKKKLGSNLLFYLLSIALLFIFIRVLLKRFNISPTIREGLIESQDICEISKQRRFTARNDFDDGKTTADNLFKPASDLVMEHLDHAVKFKNKNSSKDMEHVSELKKSAYNKIKNTIQKGYESIKDDCSDKNELYKKRNAEFKKMLFSGEFKDKQKKYKKELKSWEDAFDKKFNVVANKNVRKQFKGWNSYIFLSGLPQKFNKDTCRMLIEDPDTIKGNVSAKQKMKKFIEQSFENRHTLFNNIKDHRYFKDLDEDYKRHQEQEKAKKKTKSKK